MTGGGDEFKLALDIGVPHSKFCRPGMGFPMINFTTPRTHWSTGEMLNMPDGQPWGRELVVPNRADRPGKAGRAAVDLTADLHWGAIKSLSHMPQGLRHSQLNHGKDNDSSPSACRGQTAGTGPRRQKGQGKPVDRQSISTSYTAALPARMRHQQRLVLDPGSQWGCFIS